MENLGVGTSFRFGAMGDERDVSLSHALNTFGGHR